MKTFDPIKLEIFKHLFAAAAEEMGVTLRKASYSPNIKERRDFSCALFDAQGNMVAQAAHIPVHLGSMPLSVAAAIRAFDPGSSLSPGDVIMLNDPFRGGTHLPDITLVSPVYLDAAPSMQAEGPILIGFVASRAHHADVGGMTAGSMPVAREIYQEGLIIPPVKLVRSGQIDRDLLDLVLANVRTPEERAGDLRAQIAANQRGARRLVEMASRYGLEEVWHYMGALIDYTERLTRALIEKIPDGVYSFVDYLDDDGVTDKGISDEDSMDRGIPIRAQIRIQGDQAVVDFSGSAPQQKGSVNAVYAITLSAVYYVFRCLLSLDAPNNAGCLAPIQVNAPEGSVVNALPPAPVAGGNVETSQRIVDVLLGALAQADQVFTPIPAASQGTMNNITIGGHDPEKGRAFAYYETIGGGMGARPTAPGPSAIHSHMTNTLNTPVEALEYAYPLRITRYEIRPGSGGEGKFRGGDGIRRDIQALVDCQVSMLSERRRYPPYGLAGGAPGHCGENVRIRQGEQSRLPGKGAFELRAGDTISIRTPGGGGYGRKNVD